MKETLSKVNISRQIISQKNYMLLQNIQVH